MHKETFFCPMCQKHFLKRGKAIYVGKPKTFLICLYCWKGWVVRNCGSLKEVYQGTEKWKE